MELKPRLKDPRYWSAKSDFKALEDMQGDYGAFFPTHPIHAPGNHQREKERIEKEWLVHPVVGGGRSKEKDLENLWIAWSNVNNLEIERRATINLLFARIYEYFSEILLDYEIGYVNDQLMEEYMVHYKNAIATNKNLSLDCWNREPIKLIEKQIAKIVKTKN